MSIRELSDALDIRRTAVLHHVRRLGQRKLVRCVRAGRRLLVFPAGATPFEGLLGLVRLRMVQRLIEAIQANPRMSMRALARQLGITPKAVRYHVKRLQGLGLLDRRRGPDGDVAFILEPKVLEAMAPTSGLQASFKVLA